MTKRSGLVEERYQAAGQEDCSYEEHDAIRGNALRFLRETTPIGIMPDGERGLILAVCKACNTTIARPLPEPSPGERLDAAKVCLFCGGRAEADAVCDACAGWFGWS